MPTYIIRFTARNLKEGHYQDSRVFEAQDDRIAEKTAQNILNMYACERGISILERVCSIFLDKRNTTAI